MKNKSFVKSEPLWCDWQVCDEESAGDSDWRGGGGNAEVFFLKKISEKYYMRIDYFDIRDLTQPPKLICPQKNFAWFLKILLLHLKSPFTERPIRTAMASSTWRSSRLWSDFEWTLISTWVVAIWKGFKLPWLSNTEQHLYWNFKKNIHMVIYLDHRDMSYISTHITDGKDG